MIKRRWIGHTLRKGNQSTEKRALDWIPQKTEKHALDWIPQNTWSGRPKQTYKWTILTEAGQ